MTSVPPSGDQVALSTSITTTITGTILSPEFIKRAETLYHNAFGFQSPSLETPEFIVAAMRDRIPPAILEQIRVQTGVARLKHIDWLGTDYLCVSWENYDRIEQVLTACLHRRISFRTHTKLSVSFVADDDHEFTYQDQERKMIDDIEENWDLYTRLNMLPKHSLVHEWNWLTPEGRALCQKLRRFWRKPEVCRKPEKHDFWRWPIFQNCDRRTLRSVPVAAPLAVPVAAPLVVPVAAPLVVPIIDLTVESEEVDECMICLTEIPDTMVLPCEHVVVCKTCSIRLRQTRDARVCVRCRCPITHVLE